MSIFDELQAEFVEQGKYCKLLVGPPVDKEGFEQVEVADEYFGAVGYVTRMVQVEEPLESPEKPRLYVVEGAPELVDLEAFEETETEKTTYIPVIKHDRPKPPSLKMLDETQVIPVVEEEDRSKNYTDTFFDPALVVDEDHIFPIRRVKAIHKKISATGTLGWFTSHRAA